MKNASLSALFCILLIISLFLLIPVRKREQPPPAITEYITLLHHESGKVSKIAIDEYVLKCLAKEMPASFETEALKAQAVAIRTNALYLEQNRKHDNATVCTDFGCCAAFLDDLTALSEENISKLKGAVSSTTGQILLYENKPINAVFHAISAGKTANSEDIWNKKVPYLRSADSSLDKNVKKFETKCMFSWNELFDIFSVEKKSISNIIRADSGYVKSVSIGGKVFSGAEIRKKLNLRSTAFIITEQENAVEFKVSGYGHGVGMSQWGANEYAKQGKRYDEILRHYYKGAEVNGFN